MSGTVINFKKIDSSNGYNQEKCEKVEFTKISGKALNIEKLGRCNHLNGKNVGKTP